MADPFSVALTFEGLSRTASDTRGLECSFEMLRKEVSFRTARKPAAHGQVEKHDMRLPPSEMDRLVLRPAYARLFVRLFVRTTACRQQLADAIHSHFRGSSKKDH